MSTRSKSQAIISVNRGGSLIPHAALSVCEMLTRTIPKFLGIAITNGKFFKFEVLRHFGRLARM